MNRHRKFLVIASVLAMLAVACGPKKTQERAKPKTPTQAAPIEDDDEENLEAECFAGDQRACDKLGH